MADEQLFETEDTEGKQVKEEVDPRLVTDKAKTCQTFRCRNLAEKNELRDAYDAYRISRGKATVGEVIPAITALIERETGEAPTAISAHMNALAEGLDLVRIQAAAISACYATVEEREQAKSKDKLDGLADQLAEVRTKAKADADELEKAKAKNEQLEGDLEDARAEVARLEDELRVCKERDAINRDVVKALTAALAVSPEEQAAAVKKLLGEE